MPDIRFLGDHWDGWDRYRGFFFQQRLNHFDRLSSLEQVLSITFVSDLSRLFTVRLLLRHVSILRFRLRCDTPFKVCLRDEHRQYSN